MKFRGFRATINFASSNHDRNQEATPMSVTGAYRIKKEEFFGSGSYTQPVTKITPAMVKLPEAFQPDPTDPDVIKAAKSTPNLAKPATVPPNLAKSTPDVSLNPRGSATRNPQVTGKPNVIDPKTQAKEQKKLEKKALAEQKKRERIEAQERAKEEKLRKERERSELRQQAKQEKLKKEAEKAEAQKQAKLAKKNATSNARNPLARGGAPPPPPPPPPPNPTGGYSTNTLESSISKSSGPPPYTDRPVEVANPTLVQNENDNTGNTSFGKPIESDNTWDMINQHRQQITRIPVGAGARQAGGAKQVLHFKLADNISNGADDNKAEAPGTGRKSLYV